jgi:hypothetical protein
MPLLAFAEHARTHNVKALAVEVVAALILTIR